MEITRWYNHESWSRIEVDCRDGSKDFWIPTKDAERLYEQGKLSKNMTNFGMYCTPVVGQDNISSLPEITRKNYFDEKKGK